MDGWVEVKGDGVFCLLEHVVVRLGAFYGLMSLV